MSAEPSTAPRWAGVLLLALLTLILGCGSQQPPPVKWQEGMQSWFSNSSVRPDEPPRLLWTRKDEDLFLRRIGYADVVALGTIRLVTIFSRFSQHRQLSVAFRPSAVLYGELEDHLAGEQELYLKLGPSDLDFQLALRVQQHLPGSKYVLLLKMKPDEGKQKQQQKKKKRRPVLRWALYRPDQRLLREIHAMYQWLDKKDEEPPDEEKDEEKDEGKSKDKDTKKERVP